MRNTWSGCPSAHFGSSTSPHIVSAFRTRHHRAAGLSSGPTPRVVSSAAACACTSRFIATCALPTLSYVPACTVVVLPRDRVYRAMRPRRPVGISALWTWLRGSRLEREDLVTASTRPGNLDVPAFILLKIVSHTTSRFSSGMMNCQYPACAATSSVGGDARQWRLISGRWTHRCAL